MLLLPIDLIFKVKEFLTDYTDVYNKTITHKINYFEKIPPNNKYSLLLICYGFGAAKVVYECLQQQYPLKEKYKRGINVYGPPQLSFDSFSIIKDFGLFIRGLADELCNYRNDTRYEMYVNKYKNQPINDLPVYDMIMLLHFDAVLSKYKHTAYTSYKRFFLQTKNKKQKTKKKIDKILSIQKTKNKKKKQKKKKIKCVLGLKVL